MSTPKKSMLTGIENAISYLSSQPIKVQVGEEDARTFIVHKDLLTSRSRFFAKALRGYQDGTGSSSTNASTEVIQWKEGEEGVIELPDDDPIVFEAYLQLAYRGHLPICRPIAQQPDTFRMSAIEKGKAKKDFQAAEGRKIVQEFEILAKMYVLADKIRDVAAKGSLLSAFVEATTMLRYDQNTHFPEAPVVNLIYDSTVSGDPLREFLTDCYVLVGSTGWVGNTPTTCSREFLFDVVVGMYNTRLRPSDYSKIQDASAYVKKLKADEE